MIYLISRNGKYELILSETEPESYILTWPEGVSVDAVEYIDDSLDVDAANSQYLAAEVLRIQLEDKASRIKVEFDKCDMLVGQAAVDCFGTTNVDAMNADKDTIVEILKGNGYLVGSGFKARRDLPEELIVKGQELNSQSDLERYAAAMWQRILDYGQVRVELMASRDNAVEAIENE